MDDSSSRVYVTLYSNPSDGHLSPSNMLFAPVRKGIIQFENLSIDKIGISYRLKFDLWVKNSLGKLVQTTVETIGMFYSIFLEYCN